MIGKPERAISTASEDKLDRKLFVARLCDALVDRTKNASTGVVLGITGPWGSGKSSVLNMIQEQLTEDYPDVVIVRFDPWLISGSSDLISQFMAELTHAVDEKAKTLTGLKKVVKQLTSYGEVLSPGINIVVPMLGTAIQGGFKAASKALSTEGSLTAVRATLVKSLSSVEVPIVVLVDELDRVEDAEILTVAQLVRAVVDFPRVSFGLAYDVDRVVQALGRNSTERGRAYLEKIVQLQVPLPIQMPAERASVLQEELERMELRDRQGSPLIVETPQFLSMVQLLNRGYLDTPRDIKRLCGAFQALYGMVGHEVAWVELLGYAALLTKHPQLIERLKRDPERMVYNTIDSVELQRRATAKQGTRSDWIDARLGELTAMEARALMLRLFPMLDERPRIETPVPGALAYRRPLLTVMRLGLVPGDFSREDAEALMGLGRSEVLAELRKLEAGNRLGSMFDRLDGVVHDRGGVDKAFWLGLADYLAKPDAEPLTRYPVQENLCGEAVSLIRRACAHTTALRAGFAELVEQLVSEQEVSFTSGLLRPHLWTYGLTGSAPTRNAEWFLSRDQTSQFAEVTAALIQRRLSEKTLLDRTYCLEPIDFLQTLRQDKAVRSAIQDFVSTPAGVDTMSLLWYGSGYRPGRSTIETYCGVNVYQNAIASRRRSLPDHLAEVSTALNRAEEALQ